MLPNKRLQEILQKNAEFEKESPYNFCDRWCERCIHEKQMRCNLYHDELEQKITCIAHGREPDDPQITKWVMEKQFEDMADVLEEHEEELGIDFDAIDDPEFQKIKDHIKFVENNPLQATADQYRRKAHEFLDGTFFKGELKDSALASDFEAVAWYHTLLPAKLNRALAGFHEPACEGDISLCDAIAQLEICKKAISESTKALQNIVKKDKSLHKDIRQLLAILHNIFNRIGLMESEI